MTKMTMKKEGKTRRRTTTRRVDGRKGNRQQEYDNDNGSSVVDNSSIAMSFLRVLFRSMNAPRLATKLWLCGISVVGLAMNCTASCKVQNATPARYSI